MLRRTLTRGASALSLLVLLTAAPAAAVVADPSNDVPHLPRSCVAPKDLIPQEPGACQLTPFRKGRPTVVLWGDSHAWQFIPSLRAAVGKRDLNLVAFVMGGCPPMALPRRKQAISCEVANVKALSFVRRLNAGPEPLRVILGASWERYRSAKRRAAADAIFPLPGYDQYAARIGELAENGIPRLFRKLGKAGVRVDVTAQTAQVPMTRAPCLTGSEQPYSCDLLRAQAIAWEDDTKQWLRGQMESLRGNPRYIDVNQHFCDGTVCHGRVDGVYTFFDDLHLSATLARKLKPFFAPSVRHLR